MLSQLDEFFHDDWRGNPRRAEHGGVLEDKVVLSGHWVGKVVQTESKIAKLA